jgi:uncharacterized membrane protein
MRAFGLAADRTFEQDPKYPIRLLVDIAIKALSPAINDPTTAVQAIDQLEDLLRRLGHRTLADVHTRDRNGIVRVIHYTPNWEDFLGLSFDEIRQYGAGSVQVMRRLRSALVGLAGLITPRRRADASVGTKAVATTATAATASNIFRQDICLLLRPQISSTAFPCLCRLYRSASAANLAN